MTCPPPKGLMAAYFLQSRRVPREEGVRALRKPMSGLTFGPWKTSSRAMFGDREIIEDLGKHGEQ